MTDIALRKAGPDDVGHVARLFDEAIEWFVRIGNTGQWGTRPFSERPEQVERIRGWCSEDGAWIATDDTGAVLGFLAVGDRHDHIPPVEEPELYVRVLIRSQSERARGVGRRLLAHAEELARQAGVCLMRVDCYRGGDGSLVRFYESCGYERSAQFEVKEWPGQILQRRIC